MITFFPLYQQKTMMLNELKMERDFTQNRGLNAITKLQKFQEITEHDPKTKRLVSGYAKPIVKSSNSF